MVDGHRMERAFKDGAYDAACASMHTSACIDTARAGHCTHWQCMQQLIAFKEHVAQCCAANASTAAVQYCNHQYTLPAAGKATASLPLLPQPKEDFLVT